MADFRAVWASPPRGEPGPVAAAVLVKGIDGKLRVDRDDTTAPDLAGAVRSSAAPLRSSPRHWRSHP